MGDLTTAILFHEGSCMFGWLIDLVLSGISPREGRYHGNLCRNMNHDEKRPVLRKSAKIQDAFVNGTDKRQGLYGTRCFDDFRKSVLFYPLTGLMVAIIAGIFFRPLLICAIFVIAAFISRMYQKHIRLQLGIDLGLFGTVVCGALYGPAAGAIVGVLSYLSSVFYTDEDPKYLPVVILGIVIVGIVAGAANITAMNIVLWGIGLTLIYNAVTGGIFIAAYKSNIITCIIFCVTHVWFNYIIFSGAGARILNILM